MEDFEEMKLYWNQLAEKNSIDNETNKKILESIRKNRYESYLSKRMKETIIGMIVIVAIMIFLVLDRVHHFLANPFQIVTFTTMEIGALIAFILCFFEVLILQRLDFSAGVAIVKEKIRFYKKFCLFNLWLGYFMVIVGVAVLAYFEEWNNPPTIAIFVGIFVIIISGCFLYLNHRQEIKHIRRLEDFIDEE
jgi:ABC-type multidrug transport system fused ATPase/permease subunit